MKGQSLLEPTAQATFRTSSFDGSVCARITIPCTSERVVKGKTLAMGVYQGPCFENHSLLATNFLCVILSTLIYKLLRET